MKEEKHGNNAGTSADHVEPRIPGRQLGRPSNSVLLIALIPRDLGGASGNISDAGRAIMESGAAGCPQALLLRQRLPQPALRDDPEDLLTGDREQVKQKQSDPAGAAVDRRIKSAMHDGSR